MLLPFFTPVPIFVPDRYPIPVQVTRLSLGFFTIISYLSCLNLFLPLPPFNSCLLSWLSHLSVSLIFHFLPATGMSFSLLSPPFPYLAAREICLLLPPLFPHTSGIQSPNQASPCSPPVFIYESVPPQMCESSVRYTNQQESSQGFCPEFRHASELMT